MYVVIVEDYDQVSDTWGLKGVLGPFDDWGTAYDREIEINQDDKYFATVARITKEL